MKRVSRSTSGTVRASFVPAASKSFDPVHDLQRQRTVAKDADDEERAVTYQQFRDFLIAERERMQNCATLPFTMILWIVFAVVAWLHGNVESMHRLRYGIHEAITDIQVPHASHGTNVTRMVSLDTIETTDELWKWTIDGLVPAFSASASRPGFVRTFNKVVGKVQLHQSRYRIGNCSIHEGLARYYGAGCQQDELSSEPFGPPSAARPEPAFVAGGHMSGLSGENQKRYFLWLDVRHPAGSQQYARAAASAQWIDGATHAVAMHMTLLNAEAKALTHVSITLTYWEGGVGKEIKVQPMQACVYQNVWHILVDVLWVALLLFFFLVLVQDAADKKGQRCIRRCCGSGWVFVDWISAAAGAVLVAFFIVFALGLGTLSEQVGAIDRHAAAGLAPSNASVAASAVEVAAARDYEARVAEVSDHVQWMLHIKNWHWISMYWYNTLILVRFFRGFMGQPRVAALGRALGASASDLLHVGIIIAIIFTNFALGGCVLFGEQLAAWSGLASAQWSTLAMLSGRGDFEAMYALFPIASTVWLFTFMVTVAFVLANMVISVLVFNHGEVQSDTGQVAQDLVSQMWALWGDWVWKAAYELRMMYRFIRSKSPQVVQHWMPKSRDEPERVSRVPYAELLEAVSEADTRPWAPVHEDLLLSCDVDEATTCRLLAKCRMSTQGILPRALPPDRMNDDFTASMEQSYAQLDAMGEELRTWLGERLIDIGNLEPRQKKLEHLSKTIEPAEPVDQPMM